MKMEKNFIQGRRFLKIVEVYLCFFFFLVFVCVPFVSVEVICSLLLESGDVCKGDVVMFVQKVYSKYSVVPFPFMPYTLTL
jgi:hypothetical protein